MGLIKGLSDQGFPKDPRTVCTVSAQEMGLLVVSHAAPPKLEEIRLDLKGISPYTWTWVGLGGSVGDQIQNNIELYVFRL